MTALAALTAGCTASAPIESDAALPAKEYTGSVSVNGANVTLAALAAAALMDFQTPPPVVPT
jgi:hypothetical protein